MSDGCESSKAHVMGVGPEQSQSLESSATVPGQSTISNRKTDLPEIVSEFLRIIAVRFEQMVVWLYGCMVVHSAHLDCDSAAKAIQSPMAHQHARTSCKHRHRSLAQQRCSKHYRFAHAFSPRFVLQLLSATDYECDSWLWCTLSINLNAQICHHLFPSVHPCHYSAIRRLLIPIAARHGLDYKGRSQLTERCHRACSAAGTTTLLLARISARSLHTYSAHSTDALPAHCRAERSHDSQVQRHFLVGRPPLHQVAFRPQRAIGDTLRHLRIDNVIAGRLVVQTKVARRPSSAASRDCWVPAHVWVGPTENGRASAICL